MLDIRAIRERGEEIGQRLALRGRGDEKTVEALLKLDGERRRLLQLIESLKSELNKLSKEFGQRKSKGEPTDDLTARITKIKAEIQELDHEAGERAKVEEELDTLLHHAPNIPHHTVPEGPDADANRVERVIGEKPTYSFKPQTHWDLAKKRGLLDLERATKISGSGFIVYTGKGAKLNRALLNYLLDLHTTEHGYTEVSTPYVVLSECMRGTGQHPKFKEDGYHIEDSDLWLVPTAEVPVTNLHREEIVPVEQLPIQYAAYTPCFRREAGSAGKDTRGMIRVHQFDKIELVHIVKPEDSYATLEKLTGHAEQVLKNLGLHYRVVSLSTGDLGFGAAKCYDIEVWAPGLDTWLEVSSCSNFEDFQARRLKLRYKDAEGRNTFLHTLNGSGTALARLYIALLETYQQEDGSILIPEPLRRYLGSDTL